MKKITPILMMLFVAFVANAQLQEEGFGAVTIPSGWTESNTTSCTWEFGYTGNMPGSGGIGNEASFPSGAALFNDSPCGPLSNDRAIITGPSIDISAITNAEIEVIYNLQVHGDKGEFIIEVFDGAIWQQVYLQEEDTPRNTGENQTITLDISTHINNAFSVRFIFDDEMTSATTETSGLGIDNYKLSDTSVAGIDQLAGFGFKYSPNPVSNVLELKAEENIQQINIYNVIGMNVMSLKPSKSFVRLNMNKLPTGAYIVHIQIDSKVGSFKVLKQ